MEIKLYYTQGGFFVTEKLITLSLLFSSTTYLFFANQLTFGTLLLPKSGFLPTLAGIIAVIVALLLIVNQFHPRKSVTQDKVDWTKFIFLIIGLLFYIMIFNVVGYFTATFIFLFYLFKIADTSGWVIPFMMAVTSSTIFHLIFKYYLKVTLP